MLDTSCIAEFELFVHDFMSRHNIPGLALALARGDEIAYMRPFGLRNRELGLGVTTDTIFGIASITKSFTAMAVGKLAEQGKLSFDDPVVKYLPGFRLPGGVDAGVTLRHLLTHTSGLPAMNALRTSFRSHSSPDAAELPFEPLVQTPINTYSELVEYIANFAGTPLGCPGERFNYSNEGYALLGAVVRQVSGMPFAAFVRRHFFEAMDMARTTFSFEEMYEFDEVTTLHTPIDDGSLQSSRRWPCAPAFHAAGRIKSSVEDLIRPFQMYALGGMYKNKHILSEQIVAETLTPHFANSLHGAYGHAINIRSGYHGVTLASHGGGGKGISSHAGLVLERKLSAVVLTNVGGAPVTHLWGALMNLGLGLPLDTPRVEYVTSEWPQDTVQQYAGRYQSAEGADFRLVAVEGQLRLEDKSGGGEIKRVGEDAGIQVTDGPPQEFRFYRDLQSCVIIGVNRGSRFIPRTEA